MLRGGRNGRDQIGSLLTLVVAFALIVAYGVVFDASPANATSTAVSTETEYRAALATLSGDSSGPHTITLTADITLVLASPDPTYSGTQDLTIDGAGHTIDANGLGRVLLVNVDSGVKVTFTDVTLTGGLGSAGSAATNSGGAVYSLDGDIELIRAVVSGSSGNSGGGIALSHGTLYAIDSLITDNYAGKGGGVEVERLWMIGSTVQGNGSGNDSDGGAGVMANLEATIINSTITGNSYDGDSRGEGGAGLYARGSVTLIYTTIAGNVMTDGPAAQADNLRIKDMGAGAGADLVAFGSVVGDPSSRFNCEIDGTTTSAYSYDDDGTCGFTDATDTSAGADPQLGVLADNGGPTQTRLPSASSPLIDAIPSADCDTTYLADQRGTTRPEGSACDIGSVELVAPTAVDDPYETSSSVELVVDSAGGVLANDLENEGGPLTVVTPGPFTSANGSGTLNADGSFTFTPDGSFVGDDTFTYEATNGIHTTNTATVTVTVTVPTSVGTEAELKAALVALSSDPGGPHTVILTEDIVLGGGHAEYSGDQDLTIDGDGHSVSGNDASRVFYFPILDGVTVTLTDVIVEDGWGSGEGGGGAGIKVNASGTDGGDLVVVNSVVRNNFTTEDGGGIAVSYGGDLTLIDSMVLDNRGEDGGGVTGSHVEVIRSTVANNQADSWEAGGGIFGGSVTLVNSTVTGNSAGDGSGVYSRGPLEMVYSTVAGNTGGTQVETETLDGGAVADLSAFGSVVANPSSSNCAIDGATTSTYSYDTDDTCGFTDATDTSNGADPALGVLADNGGPTQTMLPAAASPLVEAIPSAACDTTHTTDQRGVSRPQGTHCDIGSVELVEPTAVEDVSVPVLAEFSFSPTSLDASTGPVDVTVTLRITDDLSGFDDGRLYFMSPTEAQRVFAYVDSSDVVSCDVLDPLDCVYEETLTIPQFAEMGTWTVEYFEFGDVVGNQNLMEESDFVAAGLPTEIEQTGVEDVSVPVLAEFSFSPTSLDASTGPVDVTVTLRITDDLSGFDDGRLYFMSPTEAQRVFAYVDSSDVVSCDVLDPLDCVYEETLTIPQFAEMGTWTVEYFEFGDVVGNQNFMEESDFVAAGLPTEIEQTGVEDVSVPVLAEFSFSPTSLDASTGPVDVTVTLRITDDLSGFDDGRLYFMSPTEAQRVFAYVDSSDVVSCDVLDPLDCVYEETLTIPQFAEMGTWTVEYFEFGDVVGNQNLMEESDFVAAGLQPKSRLGWRIRLRRCWWLMVR